MAKPNNNKKQNNYFTKNIQKDGEDFLNFKNSMNIKNDSTTIFRDLARGKIDINKYGHYFLDNTFLTSLIDAANEKFIIHDVSFRAMNFYTMNAMDQSLYVRNVWIYQKKQATIYSIILNYLNEIYRTRSINHLWAMVNQLSQYKYDI